MGSTKLSAFVSNFLCRFHGEMGRALIRTFIARAIAALGTLGLTLVVGRLYGPTGVGVYALAYSLLMGAGILAKGGMDNALMRYVGQNHDSPLVLNYLRWAVLRGCWGGLLAAAIIFFARFWFESVFGSERLSALLAGISIAVPAYVFGFLLAGFFKGVRKPATACLLENGSIALVAGLLVWGGGAIVKKPELANIGYAYAVAAWIVAFQGGFQLWAWFRRQPWWAERKALLSNMDSVATVSRQQFSASSWAFFMTNLASFTQSVLGVLVAGWMLSSSDLGLFKSSQQVAVLIGFVLIVINANFPPRFASLFYKGKFDDLERLARQGALLGVTFGMPMVLVCLLFPEWVLSWFGNEFKDGAVLLKIIACAQLVNVSTGSVGFLLNMTGHEKLMRNLALLCQLLGLLAFFVFIPIWGVLGAAFALSLALVLQNLVALFYVWRRLSIWTLPGPNLLLLIGVRSFKQ